MPVTDVDRRRALEVRQGEGHPPVAAERRAQQREQRLVLINRQELPVAESPPLRRKTETHNSDLGQERFGHSASPLRKLQIVGVGRQGGAVRRHLSCPASGSWFRNR